MPRKARKQPAIFVVSDSTGNLARHMISAFLTQFPPGAALVQFENFVRTEARLREVLARAKAQQALVAHAVVGKAFKKKIVSLCRSARLRQIDLTGDLVGALAEVIGVKPSADLASLHLVDEAYKRRIGALEFTLNHDDGLGTDTLADAEIVLAGISRTGKTPTSIYLAQQGYRVANVALAFECAVPASLLAIAKRKVAGLIIAPEHLAMIRARRQQAWRSGDMNYADVEHVRDEIEWSRRLFRKQGWPTIDVTDQAVEETAARILEVVDISASQDSTDSVRASHLG